MKKSVFIILFALISMLLLYSPIPKTIAQSPECFSSSIEGFVSNDYDKVSLDYKYESVATSSWKADALGQFFVQDLTQQGELFERVLSTSSVNEQDNCKAYSFSFQRLTRTLNYEIPLKERIDSEGTSYCVYQLTDEITDDLAILGGAPTTLSQICSDLQEGVELNSSQDCPATATCEVEINQGQQENYLLGISSDNCGNYIAETINEGNPVEDIFVKAQEFVNQCVARVKSGASAMEIATNAQTGSNENTQTTGNTNENQVVSGCAAFFQLFQQQPDAACLPSAKNIISAKDSGEDECDCTNKKKCLSYNKKHYVCCNNDEECGKTNYGENAEDIVWCVPSDPNKVPCPQNTSRCTRGQKGDSVACCPTEWTCHTYQGSAWCDPSNAAECKPPKTQFCTRGSGNSLSNTCCLPQPEESCVDSSGYIWCQYNKDKCKEKKGTPCGFYCCNENQVCSGNGIAPDSCTWKKDKSCPEGKEKCTGTANGYISIICCGAGTCISSLNGPPLCKNQYLY